MKKIVFKNFKVVCWRCHGMTTIELPSGDCKDCPVCKGKGYL